MNKQRHSEKIQMKKTIKAHEEKKTKGKKEAPADTGAVPAYLLDREHETQAKNISSMVKQKRKEKAGKWEVPIPNVKAVSEADVFKHGQTETQGKGWKMGGAYSECEGCIRSRCFQAWSNRNARKRLENGRCLFRM